MVKLYPLEMRVPTNTDFTLEEFRALRIDKVGTDDTVIVTLRIQDRVVGEIIDLLGNLRPIASNVLGPADLRDRFLVVPPLGKIRFDGTAAKVVLIKGTIAKLEPGEAMPGDWSSRFAEQDMKHYRVKQGTATGTGTSLASGAEVEVFSVTVPSNERHTLDHRFFIEQVAAGVTAEADGDLGVRIKLDDEPLDLLKADSPDRGLSRFSLDTAPADTDTLTPFTLEPYPVRVEPNHKLSITVMNITAAALFATTQAQFQTHYLYRFDRIA